MTFTDLLREKNFLGHYYERSNDGAELEAHLTRCNSTRLESICWTAYEKPNYSGYQYMLHKGSDYHHWEGLMFAYTPAKWYLL